MLSSELPIPTDQALTLHLTLHTKLWRCNGLFSQVEENKPGPAASAVPHRLHLSALWLRITALLYGQRKPTI